MATVLRLTLVMRSMMGMRMISPGPLALITRPKRKITPRSYSLSTLSDTARNRMNKITTGSRPPSRENMPDMMPITLASF